MSPLDSGSLRSCVTGRKYRRGARLIRINKGRRNEEERSAENSGRLQNFNLKDPGLDVQYLSLSSIICKLYALAGVS